MRRVILGAAILLSAAAAAVAGDPPAGEVILKGSEVRALLGPNLSNATLTVTGPNGFYSNASSKAGSVSIDLIRAGATAEGQYTFQVTAATNKKAVNANPMDNGRGGVDKDSGFVPAATSGSFYASGGIIKENSGQVEAN